MNKTKSILALIFISLVSLAKAQDYTYYLSSDTIWYSIGGRIMITHEWSMPQEVEAEAPMLPTSFKKLEQVEIGDVISQTIDGKKLFRQSGVYTCFDTGYYEIRPLGWKVKEDSIFSNPIFVEITMLPVDTSQEIMDIENPINVPYTLKEALPLIAVSLVAILLIAGLVYYIRYRKRQKSGLTSKKPEKPAHIEAFERLEHLKAQKLWQQDKVSEYHFQLSFIIRSYIQKRYSVDALDLTTGELNVLCSKLDIENKLLEKLINNLRIGDLAKFAKANPLPNENEEALEIIETFVRNTFQKPELETDAE